MRPLPTYLGDGVYADTDGFHITLATGNHRNIVVALDPEVARALADIIIERRLGAALDHGGERVRAEEGRIYELITRTKAGWRR